MNRNGRDATFFFNGTENVHVVFDLEMVFIIFNRNVGFFLYKWTLLECKPCLVAKNFKQKEAA
jgi:hypothetical protein